MESGMKKIISAVVASAFLLGSGDFLKTQNQNSGSLIFVKKASKPPLIDGILSDGEWDGTEIAQGDWKLFYPSFGDSLGQETFAFATYDDSALYFALRCFDTESAKIKTYISKRDEGTDGDWIGVLLDSLNTRESCYALYSNPSGVQGDMVRFSNDTAEEADWVWDCAGQVTKEGYVIEIEIPLTTIRYKGGSETRMGLSLRRALSRLGTCANWPEQPPGKGPLMVMATLVYSNLPEQRTRKILPSLTYARDQDRATSASWAPADSKADFGLNLKCGISSSLTLDGTYNPDFSQVESDAFQVEVNQRFPVYYEERRPFFMEGRNIFKMPLSGSYYLPGRINRNHDGTPPRRA